MVNEDTAPLIPILIVLVWPEAVALLKKFAVIDDVVDPPKLNNVVKAPKLIVEAVAFNKSNEEDGVDNEVEIDGLVVRATIVPLPLVL